MKMTKISHLLLAFTLVCAEGFAAIENSIVPEVDFWEQRENLPVAKYAGNQYREIIDALDRKEESLRILSYNVLFDLNDEKLPELYRWPQRAPRILELLEELQPDIIGVQELTAWQWEDLRPSLEQSFGFCFEPRSNGECNGILYRKERFDVLQSRIWFMADSPDDPSAKTLSMVKLLDRKTGKVFIALNTHFSFSRINQREYEARFIADKVRELSQEAPLLLTGDLNTFAHRLDLTRLPAYDGDYVHRILTQGTLKDAKEVSLLGHLGPISTFTNAPEDGIAFQGLGTPGIFLDHIYVSPGIAVLIHAVQPATVNGYFPSDHMPLMIDCLME